MVRARVLVVGPPDRFPSLQRSLREAGDEVAAETEILAVPRAIRAFRPDVIVVAATYDDVDTVTATCRRARALGGVPVVALPDVHDPCFCQAVLQAGAYDCVAATDPVDLIATHVWSVLVHRDRVPPPAMEFGNLLIDEAARTVRRDGEPVRLGALEFGLLAELARRPGVLVRRDALRNHLWTHHAARNSVDQAISRLRRKLQGACVIRTIRGVGYVLIPAEAPIGSEAAGRDYDASARRSATSASMPAVRTARSGAES